MLEVSAQALRWLEKGVRDVMCAMAGYLTEGGSRVRLIIASRQVGDRRVRLVDWLDSLVVEPALSSQN